MDAIVLCGVQGYGKTTLYRDRFLATHVRDLDGPDGHPRA